MKNKIPYLVACIDNFLNYCMGYFEKEQEWIILRSVIIQVLGHAYLELIKSDNWKELTKKILNVYLVEI